MIIDQLPELTNTFDTDEIPIERGTNTYKTKIAVFFSGLRDLIAARVAKSGDTMTGNLTFDNGYRNIFKSTFDVTEAPSSSIVVTNQSDFVDKNNVQYAYFRGRYSSDSNLGLQLGATRNGVNNLIAFNINSSGVRTIQLSDAGIWRKALNIGTDGALPITVPQGGTGQTAVTETTAVSSIATAGSNVTLLASNYVQWGKIAQLRLAIKATAAISAGSVLATLVSDKKPKTTTFIGATQSGRTGYISTTGAVSIGQSLAADASVTLLATYLLP